jgi:acetyltransferase-like isoleucine patch superfamily enzyme
LSNICETRITIEKDTLIGTNLEFMDSDFHGVSVRDRQGGRHKTAPIHVCQNAWIGSNVCVCKGVVIGRNSVIAAGSVVTRDIPENVVAGGVPARVIRSIDE